MARPLEHYWDELLLVANVDPELSHSSSQGFLALVLFEWHEWVGPRGLLVGLSHRLVMPIRRGKEGGS